MAQYSYGTADVSIGNWIDEGDGTSNLYDGLNAQTYDESTFIQSVNNPDFGDFYVGSLGPAPTAPAASVGTFKYIYAKTGARDLEGGFRVFSGTTELSIGTHAGISTSTTQSEITFSTDQGINYSDLSWSVHGNDTGGGGATDLQVYWIELEFLDAEESSSATTRQLGDLTGLTDNLKNYNNIFTRDLTSQITSGVTFEHLKAVVTETNVSVVTGSAQLSDQITKESQFTRTLQDSNVVTDQLNRWYSVYTRFLSDSNVLTENQINDVTDAGVASSATTRLLGDSATFSDQALHYYSQFTRNLSDTFTFSDQVQHYYSQFTRNLQDTATFSDQLNRWYSVFTRFITDSNVLSENQDNTVTEVGGAPSSATTRQLADLAGLTDQIRTGDVPSRWLQDTFTFTDQISASSIDYSQHIYTIVHLLSEEIV